MSNQEYKICIEYNNCCVRVMCSICYKSFKKNVPLALFQRGGDLIPVCEECGKIHAPEMVIMLDYFYDKLGYYYQGGVSYENFKKILEFNIKDGEFEEEI